MSRLTQNDTKAIREAIAQIDRAESYLMTAFPDLGIVQEMLRESTTQLALFLRRKGYTR